MTVIKSPNFRKVITVYMLIAGVGDFRTNITAKSTLKSGGDEGDKILKK